MCYPEPTLLMSRTEDAGPPLLERFLCQWAQTSAHKDAPCTAPGIWVFVQASKNSSGMSKAGLSPECHARATLLRAAYLCRAWGPAEVPRKRVQADKGLKVG